jgi:ribulose-5-phosphate 4-epimerase/fuculose-1-phosphate aldolase
MNAPLKNAVASVREAVSAEEWKTRVDLAACYRLMHYYGMSEMISNHITARLPDNPDHFLVNPYGMLYNHMTASCLIKLDVAGNVLINPNSDLGASRTGFVIHGAIHAARHDVDCVIHAHTLSGMAVSAMKCGLLPIAQISMRWARGVAYHDYESIATDLAEQERLVRDLGENNAMILRNHGLLTCGPTIAECFNSMFWLKRACDLQVMMMSCHTEMVVPSPAVIDKTWNSYQPGVRRNFGVLEWPALIQELDRIDPSYRN